MSDQPRLHEMEDARQMAELLAQAVKDRDRPWSAHARAELAVHLASRLDETQRPRLVLRWALAAVVAVAAAGGGFLLTRSSGHPVATLGTIPLGDEGTLEVSSDGAVDLPPVTSANPGRRIVLKSGGVCAEVAHRDLPRQGPLIVEAPNLRVVVVGTHFCVTTANGESEVSVTQGRVRAESPSGHSVPVSAGESVRSDDRRLAAASAVVAPSPAPAAATAPADTQATAPVIAPALVPAAVPVQALPPTPACAGAVSIEDRRACYTRVARGHDVAAENALYGLGLLERDEVRDGAAALAAWRLYEERFPAGVFAPEASLAALGELLGEKRYPEALHEADRYLATDEDSDKDRVELVRAQLLVGPMAKPDEALPLLRRLVGAGDRSVREEALFARAVCEQSLGRMDDAAATFRQSLDEYPAGVHAAEIRSRAK